MGIELYMGLLRDHTLAAAAAALLFLLWLKPKVVVGLALVVLLVVGVASAIFYLSTAGGDLKRKMVAESEMQVDALDASAMRHDHRLPAAP